MYFSFRFDHFHIWYSTLSPNLQYIASFLCSYSSFEWFLAKQFNANSLCYCLCNVLFQLICLASVNTKILIYFPYFTMNNFAVFIILINVYLFIYVYMVLGSNIQLYMSIYVRTVTNLKYYIYPTYSNIE